MSQKTQPPSLDKKKITANPTNNETKREREKRDIDICTY